MASDASKQGAGLFGIGAAACAACCAGPIIGVLTAAGLLTVAAYVVTGLAGLAVAVPLAAWTIRRRRARHHCAAGPEPMVVELGLKPDPTT